MRELTVLTGASRGLGYAIWQELLARDLAVLVVARGDSVQLRENARQGMPWLSFDLTRAMVPDEMEAFAAQLQSTLQASVFDKLTFINNAGAIEPIDKVGELDSARFLEAVALNFVAPAMIANVCAAEAKARNATLRVLNISSGAANHAIGGWSSYCSTKSATKMFMDVLHKDADCEVVHIDPGVMDTQMQSTIRNAPVSSFADVNNFIAFADEGKLHSPAAVGKHIVVTHYDV